MRYTDEKPPQDVYPVRTLQVFSVKVAAIAEELGWPLDVFGIVAARDSLDHNRNIIFGRQRDNCQTIDSEVCIFVSQLFGAYVTSVNTICSGIHMTSNYIQMYWAIGRDI